ncbi:MAG TPA: porin [Methylococcus sp.]|nr:porin [Methylococcus sp.]
MKWNRPDVAVSALLGGMLTLPAQALELYVDVRTNQVFTEPGPHRAKLGSFQPMDESKPEQAPAKVATTEDVKQVEAKLNKKIDAFVNKPKKPNEAKTTIDGKGIRFETNDGAFKFALNGRLHTDGNVFSGGDIATFQDKNNSGKWEPGDPYTINRVTDGTEIRRFRMEFAAQFFDNWKMKMQPEIANAGGNGTVGIRDAYVQYTGFDWGEWTVGQSKQPYSFQQMMSSNDMVFMERSLEYEFTNRSVNRAIGLRYDIAGDWWSFATGIYGDTATRQAGGTTEADDEGWGFAGRVTMAPWYKPDELLHVGVSGAFRQPRTGDRTVRYNIAPTAISHVNYLDTGKLPDIRNSQFFNAELVGVYGPLSIESEYNATWFGRLDSAESGLTDGFLHGAHFDVAYSLTGESRAAFYDAKQAIIRRIVPDKNLDFGEGWGAWELKGRIAYVNMNDVGDPTNSGGAEAATTFGVNWYFNNWARVMLDWTHVLSLDVGKAGVNRRVLPLKNNDPNDWDIVQARVSLAY